MSIKDEKPDGMKVTREEALKVKQGDVIILKEARTDKYDKIEVVDGSAITWLELWKGTMSRSIPLEEIVRIEFQQPTLDSDIEKALHVLRGYQVDDELEDMYNLIKQHIAEKDSRLQEVELQLEEVQEDNFLLKQQLQQIRKWVGEQHIIKNEKGTPYTPKEHKLQAYDEVLNILLGVDKNE